MTIRYASDLHLEFGMNSQYMQAIGLDEGGDILLLAGDIIYLENARMERDTFFDWCAYNFKETFIVPGNHEYYRDPRRKGHLPGRKDVWETMMDYEHFVRPNVRYLNNKSFRVEDIEVFCTTLWTKTSPNDFGPLMYGMNDFSQIVMRGQRFLPGDYDALHGLCREWLAGALAASDATHKVVLTHHCPTMRREFDRYEPTGPLYRAFHVDMEEFIAQHDIEVWIYGHTHYNGGSGTVLESYGKGTLLLTNQLGYVEADEQLLGFRKDAKIEI